VRLFAGYSGWSAGQLEVEMAVGSWIIVDAEASDAISADPVGLWGAVLGRQPGLLGQMGTYPDDPSLN
jgi:Putative transcriptional regulator